MNAMQFDVELQTAKQKLRSGQIAEAETIYQAVLRSQPACAEAQHFLGLAAMQRGDLRQALDLMSRAVQLRPDRGEYHNNLALVLGRMNRSAFRGGPSSRNGDQTGAPVLRRMEQ